MRSLKSTRNVVLSESISREKVAEQIRDAFDDLLVSERSWRRAKSVQEGVSSLMSHVYLDTVGQANSRLKVCRQTYIDAMKAVADEMVAAQSGLKK